MSAQRSIVIGGGAFAGLALALALRQGLGAGIPIIVADAQPILDMVVTDSKLEDATRPVFLTFAGNVEPDEPFAHMVENRHLIDALTKRAEAEGIELRATAVTTFDSRSQ